MAFSMSQFRATQISSGVDHGANFNAYAGRQGVWGNGQVGGAFRNAYTTIPSSNIGLTSSFSSTPADGTGPYWIILN